MAYKVAMQIRNELEDQEGVEFTVKFTPDTVLNVLEIKQGGVIVAIDSGVSEETYHLPSGFYQASLRFWGNAGTVGELTLTTPESTVVDDATIAADHTRETITLDLVL
jgi:hypothetical protein